jgi:hypothetical protein
MCYPRIDYKILELILLHTGTIILIHIKDELLVTHGMKRIMQANKNSNIKECEGSFG